MGRLAEEKATHSRARSQLVFALLCELADADSAAPAPCRRWCRPPLRTSAPTTPGCTAWRSSANGWASPKAILVRTFTAAVGVPPGKYLTTVRIEAAQRLLLHREYTLDVVASLCGFPGPTTCAGSKKEPASPLHNGGH